MPLRLVWVVHRRFWLLVECLRFQLPCVPCAPALAFIFCRVMHKLGFRGFVCTVSGELRQKPPQPQSVNWDFVFVDLLPEEASTASIWHRTTMQEILDLIWL